MSNALILYVNSRNRLPGFGTDTEFNYYFKQLTDTRIPYTKISLLSISIPKTYYLVDDNQFFLHEGDDIIEISMPKGNYNILSFAKVLSTMLSSSSHHGFVYNVSSDETKALNQPVTGKYEYSIQNNQGVAVAIQLGKTLFEQFGFDRDSTNYFINSGNGASLTSKNVCTMNLESTLYLHSNLCESVDGDILHEVYTTETAAGSIITYDNVIPHLNYKKFKFHQNSALFKLTDEDGYLINLNGQNLVFTLLLTT